jgi:PAS domain S-box-containing protein
MDWRAQRGALVRAAQLVGVCAAYVALGRVGLMMSPVHGFSTLVWPPSGLSLAAILLGGRRLWPAIAVGAFVTNLWAGAPPAAAATIAAGNTLEALVGAWATRKVPGFRASLDRFADVVALVLLAGIGSPLLAATIGATSLLLAGAVPAHGFAETWVTWWAGDLMGVVVVAPVLLTWGRAEPTPARTAGLVEATVAGGILLASSLVVFFQERESALATPILLPYLLFLPLIWVGLRFGTRGAAIGILVVAVVALIGTHGGRGAFAFPDRIAGLRAVHVFLGAASLASLALGSVVAERERSQQAARAGEAERARLAAIVASSADAIVGKTLDGTITSWNRAAEHLYGYASAEVVGRPIAMIVPTDRLDELGDLLARVRHGERIGHVETVRRRKDGAEIEVALTVSPILDAQGAVVGASAIARDIGERKRMERELQSALRAKDEFLAVLSHELRTPLQSILGWAKMLNRPDFDPRHARKGLEVIERNVLVQARLIEDLLDVSRIVAGKLRVARRPTDLAEVLTTAIESATIAAGEKAPRLEVELAAGRSVVLGDPDRLQQIAVNLLTNALKFTPRDGVVRVRLLREDAVAKLVVEDTGCGIAAEVLPCVFDRFRQGDSSIRRAQGGLGLGLAIVRHLVELHRGTVTAESEGVGRGARFTVSLPLLAEKPATIRGTARRDRARRAEARSLGGVRVLLVDDEPDTCELLEAMVRAAGAEARTVGSAGAAIEAIDRLHPDLVVSDLGMPVEDGYGLLRRVRAREADGARHLPVIALTAFASQLDRDAALAAGFDAYLTKPVSPEELADAVEELIQRAA